MRGTGPTFAAHRSPDTPKATTRALAALIGLALLGATYLLLWS